VTYFSIFWDPEISGTSEDTNLKFCKQIDRKGCLNENSEKLAKRGRGRGHVTYFSNFGTPNISGTAEVTNLKFCMQIDRKGY